MNFEHVPKGRRACRTFLQLWWELGAKSLLLQPCLGLCFLFAAAGPVQCNNSLVLLSINLVFNRSSRLCYTPPALLHTPSHSLHPGRAPKSLQASPKGKTGGKPRQTGISREMVHFWAQWWGQGVWNPPLLFVPGSVTFSLTETHLPRMVLGIQIIWVLQALKNIHRERSNCIDGLSRKKS